jgi:hypothetical protein
MALLKATFDKELEEERGRLRVFPVTAKLTREESKAVTAFAQARGIARGQWIRDVLLAELQRASQGRDAALTEILGVRLLLVNVLRPLAAGQKLSPEVFDKLLDEISTAKHELAGKLAAEQRR